MHFSKCLYLYLLFPQKKAFQNTSVLNIQKKELCRWGLSATLQSLDLTQHYQQLQK